MKKQIYLLAITAAVAATALSASGIAQAKAPTCRGKTATVVGTSKSETLRRGPPAAT